MLCCKLSLYAILRKTNKPNLRKWQKTFCHFFSWILPLLDVRHCCKLSLHAISSKTNKPNLRKWLKISSKTNGPNLRKWQQTQLLAQSWPIWPKFGPSIFLKNLASSVTRYDCHLSPCTTSEKANDPILRKLSDGQTDGQMGRETRVISQDAVRLTSSVQHDFHFQNDSRKLPTTFPKPLQTKKNAKDIYFDKNTLNKASIPEATQQTFTCSKATIEIQKKV